jgi:cell surface protein SprA
MNEIIYSNINLVEQFNPLVKIDFVLKNSLQLSAEIRKDRALSLSLDNNLLTETTGNEFVLGTGYRFKKVKFKTNIGGRTTNLNGDINIKADLTMRNNITYVRNLDLLNNQVTAGQKLWSLKMSADYDLSRNFTALFFYDHTFSKFEISTSFPQTNIRSGLTLRYNFGN